MLDHEFGVDDIVQSVQQDFTAPVNGQNVLASMDMANHLILAKHCHDQSMQEVGLAKTGIKNILQRSKKSFHLLSQQAVCSGHVSNLTHEHQLIALIELPCKLLEARQTPQMPCLIERTQHA